MLVCELANYLIMKYSHIFMVILAVTVVVAAGADLDDDDSSDWVDVLEGILCIYNLGKRVVMYAPLYIAWVQQTGLMIAIPVTVVVILISLLLLKLCEPCFKEGSKKKYQNARIGVGVIDALTD